jgi:hypothetical protein
VPRPGEDVQFATRAIVGERPPRVNQKNKQLKIKIRRISQSLGIVLSLLTCGTLSAQSEKGRRTEAEKSKR